MVVGVEVVGMVLVVGVRGFLVVSGVCVCVNWGSAGVYGVCTG